MTKLQVLGFIGVLVILGYLNYLVTPDIYVKDGWVYQINDKKITPRPMTEEDFVSGNIIKELK